MPIYYVDGRFVPADQAVIPVDDLAILRGVGVFDLVRTFKGKPLFLQEHLARLVHSAREINLEIPWSREQIAAIVMETLAKNDLPEANVRIVVTGGSSRDFLSPSGHPRLLVLISEQPKPPRSWYEQGVKVITVQLERRLPGAKSIDYLPAAMAIQRARGKGAVEAIYLNRNRLALEGTTSNLFVFLQEGLVTTGRGILPGITRKVVLDLAAPVYSVQVRDLYYEELIGAREVFITGTTRGIMPVVQVDETTIGKGRPGPDTRKLMAMLEEYIEGLG